jgi:uncharacterized BrkB/YihY/UPF0761 family membrane protein
MTLDRVNLPMLASALTFDALLAMIPLGILLVGGVGYLLDQAAFYGPTDPGDLISILLPVEVRLTGGPDPLILTERILAAIRGYRSSLTLIAIPVFLWFSSRVFGSMRVALTEIFEAKSRQRHHQPVVDYILTYAFAKLRDLRMILLALSLGALNTVLSAAVAVFNAEGVFLSEPWSFFATTLGRLMAEVVAFGSALLLFALLYRYASPKRLHWRGAFLAAGVATVAFEIAKRLFGFYLSHVGRNGVYSVDANIGAALLFILWIWYMALVFLIGAAAAKVWEEGQVEGRTS